MRAQDLLEYSEIDNEIDSILTTKGYKKLGSGVDQSAYLEPGTGYVLKIFGTQGGEKFSADHKMFFKWVKYCMSVPKNPFVPKFGGYDSFIFNGDRYLQIRQEVLKPAGRVGLLLSKFSDAIYGDFIETLPELEKWMVEFAPSYMSDLKKLKNQLGPKGLQLLFSTMLKVYRMSEKLGYDFDLHAGNFMERADGTPVIVDPWVIDNSW